MPDICTYNVLCSTPDAAIFNVFFFSFFCLPQHSHSSQARHIYCSMIREYGHQNPFIRCWTLLFCGRLCAVDSDEDYYYWLTRRIKFNLG